MQQAHAAPASFSLFAFTHERPEQKAATSQQFRDMKRETEGERGRERERERRRSSLVPTSLRGHHADVVPGHVLPVQRLRSANHSAAFVDTKVPDVILPAVQEVPVDEAEPPAPPSEKSGPLSSPF